MTSSNWDTIRIVSLKDEIKRLEVKKQDIQATLRSKKSELRRLHRKQQTRKGASYERR